MTSAAHFLEFISLIRNGTSSLKDDELTISFENDINKSDIHALLKEIGYLVDDVRTVRKKNLNISFSAEYWEKSCPLYRSWGELVNLISNSLALPDVYYVIDSDVSSFDKKKEAKQLQVYSYTRKLIADLADHCEPSTGPSRGTNKVVYLVENESSATKYEFSPKVDFELVTTISNIDASLSAVEELTKKINLGDSQDKERANVMKSAFCEMVVGCSDEDSIFPAIITSLPEFLKKYEAHHELFVRRFSVNKLLQEISEQDLSYTSKINEIVSGAQNKALTIPGALIAIGAIMKIDHIWDAIAVFLGMLFTTIIVYRSLNVHQDTAEHLKKQVKSDFERYDTLNEEAEVRKQAKSRKTDLIDLLSTAKKNSKFMKCSIWGIFFAASIYLFISVCNINSNPAKDKVQTVSKAACQ